MGGCCGKSKTTKTGLKEDGGRRKGKAPLASNVGPMNKYILKFQFVEKTYKTVEKAFVSHLSATEKNRPAKERMHRSVELQELQALFNEMGYPTLTDEQIQETFHLSDLDKNKKIEFKEFLIASGLCCYLVADQQPDYKPNDDGLAAKWASITKGFKICRQMFNDIDADKGGTIDAEEFEAAFITLDPTRNKDHVKKRMKELDFNDDAQISLEEFIYGLSAWIGFADDEELHDEA